MLIGGLLLLFTILFDASSIGIWISFGCFIHDIALLMKYKVL